MKTSRAILTTIWVIIIIGICVRIVLCGISVVCRSSAPLDFAHIPKCAGSSVELTYAHLEWGALQSMLVNRNLLYATFYFVSPWHIPNAIPTHVPTFCIIRDPVDRFVSALNYNPNIESFWSRNMPGFQKYITNQPHAYDNHFLPQTSFARRCTHVLHMSNLNVELESLLHRYNIPVLSLKRKNVAKSRYYSKADVDVDWIRAQYKEDFTMLYHTRRTDDFRLLHRI